MPRSWVIVRLSDNTAMLETWKRSVAQKVNTSKYKAVPIVEWLASLSTKEKQP